MTDLREKLIAAGLIRPPQASASSDGSNRVHPLASTQAPAPAPAPAPASASAPASTPVPGSAPAGGIYDVPAPGDTPGASHRHIFSSVEALRETLQQKSPSDFVSRYLFESVPYLFDQDIDLWLDWKTKLAEGLQVDPREIILIGSGAIGYSLNPKKDFKAFHADSDVDVGVISPHHFELAWRYLRQLQPLWLTLPRLARNAVRSHRERYVFSGAIATDFILSLLPFGSDWQKAFDAMAKRHPTEGREIKARIYRDFDAMRHYHTEGIKSLHIEELAANFEAESSLVGDESENVGEFE